MYIDKKHRRGDVVADYLTNMGRSQWHNIAWFSPFPTDVELPVYNDRMVVSAFMLFISSV